MAWLYWVIGIVGFLLVVLIIIANSLVGKKNRVENAFAGMDAMLKKRFDLIPNLVETVKQYMTHEKDTLVKITEMRSRASAGNLGSEEKVALNNELTRALGGIMVAVENYPALKANENFMMLQRSLNETEEQISASRRSYNAAVTDYNNAVEMFPSNIFAAILGHKRKALFEIPETERQSPSVKNLFQS